MGKKGHKSQKDTGELWDEPKTAITTVSLTPTGKKDLTEMVKAWGVSISELLERIARRRWRVVRPEEEELLSAAALYNACKQLSQSEKIELIVLLAKSLSTSTPTPSITIALLLKDRNLEVVAQNSQLPLEAVEAISAGAKPTDEQLVGLARGLEIPPEELIAIRKRTFGNGQHRGRIFL